MKKLDDKIFFELFSEWKESYGPSSASFRQEYPEENLDLNSIINDILKPQLLPGNRLNSIDFFEYLKIRHFMNICFNAAIQNTSVKNTQSKYNNWYKENTLTAVAIAGALGAKPLFTLAFTAGSSSPFGIVILSIFSLAVTISAIITYLRSKLLSQSSKKKPRSNDSFCVS